MVLVVYCKLFINNPGVKVEKEEPDTKSKMLINN